MKRIILVLILFLNASFFHQEEKLFNKKGEPSKYGISYYVKQNESDFISQFEKIVNDTLYDVYITVDDLSRYGVDSDVLGYCSSTLGFSEIIITNEEKYVAYEAADMSAINKQTFTYANNFVKGTVFHELTHKYFNQVIVQMRMNNVSVSSEYCNLSMIPRNSFGAVFIEEGVCEYVAVKIGEVIFGEGFIPKSVKDITDKKNKFYINYVYSAEYVKSFLDCYGLKKGIQILVGMKPPTYDEMLYPVKFYSKISGK
jgi:hypothetical protein